MKIHTPEISWHNREPVFGVDIQKRVEYANENKFYRIATCGSDNFVAVWRAYLNQQAAQTNAKSTNSLNQGKQSSDLQSFRKQIDKDVSDVMNDLLDQSAGAFEDVLEQSAIKALTIEDDNTTTKKPKEKKLIDLDCVCTLNLHIKAVNVAKFAPTSNLLASGSDDQYVYIYEYKGDK